MSIEADLEPLDLPKRKEYTHRAHRFPGKFHPPLVSKILRDHSDLTRISDPMSGSGTVGVEAIVENREVLCMDLDPLACLMTRAKTTPVDPDDLVNVSKRVIAMAGEMPNPGEFDNEEAILEVESALENTPSVVPYNLLHWFEPHIAVGFSRLVEASYKVIEIEPEATADALRTALAATVRNISRADPQPVSGLEVTSVRLEQLENGLEFDVLRSFKSSVQRLKKGYSELKEVSNLGKAIVIQENAKNYASQLEEVGYSPNLIITSPPYCNAIEYTRRHRLEYEWLGLFPGNDLSTVRQERLDVSREFIGSSNPLKNTLDGLPEVPHRGVREVTDKIEYQEGEKKKANLLRKYFLDAYDWLEQVHLALESEGLFCMTVGPSTSYGHKIDTPIFLEDIATEIGFDQVDKHSYKLKNNKMQYETDGPTTQYESLIKFTK